MSEKRIARRIAYVLLSILLVVALITFSMSVAISQMFSVNRVNARLFENGFYDLAMESLRDEVDALQSVVGINTADVMDILSAEDVQTMLAPYTDGLTVQFLSGRQTPDSIEYLSDDLYLLICDTITEDTYAGDIAQLTADRLDAYTELTAAVNGTLNFFPQSLLDELIGGSMQTKIAPLYRVIGTIQKLWLPALAVFLVCAAGLLWLRRRDILSALRGIAGTCFVTGSVLFVPAFFIRLYSLPNRLSLADGLLRRYILTLYSHMTGSLFTVTLLLFVITAVWLTVTIILSAKSGRTSCTESADVLE